MHRLETRVTGQVGAGGLPEWWFWALKLTLVTALCCRAGGLPRRTAKDTGSSEAKPHLAEAGQASPGGHLGKEIGKHGDKESKSGTTIARANGYHLDTGSSQTD